MAHPASCSAFEVVDIHRTILTGFFYFTGSYFLATADDRVCRQHVENSRPREGKSIQGFSDATMRQQSSSQGMLQFVGSFFFYATKLGTRFQSGDTPLNYGRFHNFKCNRHRRLRKHRVPRFPWIDCAKLTNSRSGNHIVVGSRIAAIVHSMGSGRKNRRLHPLRSPFPFPKPDAIANLRK